MKEQPMPRLKLENVPLAELKKEIERRQKLLPKLIAQRDALAEQITELQRMETAVVGEPAARSRATARPRRLHRAAGNKSSLAEVLATFMKGREKVTVGEAMKGALAAGYRTTSKSFRSVVNQMLLKSPRFRSVGRGEFALKQ